MAANRREQEPSLLIRLPRLNRYVPTLPPTEEELARERLDSVRSMERLFGGLQPFTFDAHAQVRIASALLQARNWGHFLSLEGEYNRISLAVANLISGDGPDLARAGLGKEEALHLLASGEAAHERAVTDAWHLLLPIFDDFARGMLEWISRRAGAPPYSTSAPYVGDAYWIWLSFVQGAPRDELFRRVYPPPFRSAGSSASVGVLQPEVVEGEVVEDEDLNEDLIRAARSRDRIIADLREDDDKRMMYAILGSAVRRGQGLPHWALLAPQLPPIESLSADVQSPKRHEELEPWIEWTCAVKWREHPLLKDAELARQLHEEMRDHYWDVDPYWRRSEPDRPAPTEDDMKRLRRLEALEDLLPNPDSTLRKIVARTRERLAGSG